MKQIARIELDANTETDPASLGEYIVKKMRDEKWLQADDPGSPFEHARVSVVLEASANEVDIAIFVPSVECPLCRQEFSDPQEYTQHFADGCPGRN